MKTTFSIFPLALIFSLCSNSVSNELTPSPLDKNYIKASYSEKKIEISTVRKGLLEKFNLASTDQKKAIINEAGIYLDSAVSEGLFPYWKGTAWDFNGHTNVPNQGEIACGYLVSTLLKHAGFNINRYKMAQQSSLNEINTLITPSKPTLLGTEYAEVLEKLGNYENGLYILGLSSHVGFIRIIEKKIYFLHSTYLTPTAVVNELAEDSEAFKYSSVYYIGSISGNNQLIKKWLAGSNVPIVFD